MTFLMPMFMCLHPRGDVFDFLRSTPIDFAYRIHTNLGHKQRVQ